MRKIKFRAWDKDEKRMIHLANSMDSDTFLQLNNHSWGVFEPEKENYYGGASANKLRVDILMQYTGLKDKNGTEIYEGDIVKCEKRGYAFYKSVVKYNDVMGRFDIVQGDGSFPLTLEEIVDDISIGGLDYEVIGNIYENPELLEGRE